MNLIRVFFSLLIAWVFWPVLSFGQSVYFIDTLTTGPEVGKPTMGLLDLETCEVTYRNNARAYMTDFAYKTYLPGALAGYGMYNEGLFERLNGVLSVHFLSANLGVGDTVSTGELVQAVGCHPTADAFYLAGKGLHRFEELNYRRMFYIGDFPPEMEAAGDLTYRLGKVYMTTISNTLVEVDLENPMNSRTVMTFPDTIPLLHGLATFHYDCDSVRTFAASSSFSGGSVIYEIDFSEKKLVKVCDTDMHIFGLASDMECNYSGCELFVDLDADNSTGARRYDFLSDTSCTGPIRICDKDVLVSAIESVDSIAVELNNWPDGDIEILAFDGQTELEIRGEGSRRLTLINPGLANLVDFEEALQRVIYLNPAAEPTLHRRIVKVIAYSPTHVSEVAESIVFMGKPRIEVNASTTDVTCYGLADGQVRLSVAGGAAPYRIDWDHGGAGAGLDALRPGVYSFELTDAGNCTLRDSVLIQQPALLEAEVRAVSDTICGAEGVLQVVDDIGGTAPYRFLWSDGSETAVVDGLPPGQYSLTVEDANGCLDSVGYALHLRDTLSRTLSEQRCSGEVFSFRGMTFTQDTSFCFVETEPTGCTVSTCLDIQFLDTVLVQESRRICRGDTLWLDNRPLTTDTSLCVVTIGANGCDSTFCLDLEVIRPGSRILAEICEGEQFLFGGRSYDRTGLYYDTLDSESGCDSLVELQLEVLPAPKVSILGEPFICNGVPITITADEVFPEYRWSNGVLQEQITVDSPGVYALTVVNDAGCTAMDSFRVEAIDLSFEWIATDPNCAGASNGRIETTAIQGGEGPYLLSLDGNILQETVSFPNLPAGIYQLTVEDLNGCRTLQTVELTAPPEFTIFAGEDQTIQKGDTIALTIQSSDLPVSVVWNPAQWLDCDTCRTVSSSPPEDIAYQVSAVNAAGCQASDQVSISVRYEASYYTPNAFSPNGDGENDVFMLYGPLEKATIRSFKIFDRWGNMVFDRENVTPGLEEQGWDGTVNHSEAPVGVYLFFAEIQYKEGKQELMNGEVLLLR
jgi:gliding motility-associated-like protein